jgi:hypothetical protein
LVGRPCSTFRSLQGIWILLWVNDHITLSRKLGWGMLTRQGQRAHGRLVMLWSLSCEMSKGIGEPGGSVGGIGRGRGECHERAVHWVGELTRGICYKFQAAPRTHLGGGASQWDANKDGWSLQVVYTQAQMLDRWKAGGIMSLRAYFWRLYLVPTSSVFCFLSTSCPPWGEQCNSTCSVMLYLPMAKWPWTETMSQNYSFLR